MTNSVSIISDEIDGNVHKIIGHSLLMIIKVMADLQHV